MSNGNKPFRNTGLSKGFIKRNQAFINPAMPVSFHNQSVRYNEGGGGYTRNFASGRGSYYKRNVQTSQTSRRSSDRGVVMNQAHASAVNKGLKSYGKSFKTIQKGYVKSEKLISKGEKKIDKVSKRFSPRVQKAYGKYLSAVLNPGSVSEKKLKRLQKRATNVGKKYTEKVEKIATRIGGKATDVRQKAYFKGSVQNRKSNKKIGTGLMNAAGQPTTFANPIYASYKNFDKQAQLNQSNKRANITIGNQNTGGLYNARNVSFMKTRSVVAGGQNKSYKKFQNRFNTAYGRTYPDRVKTTF
jgi:hypothetical protein